MAQVYLDLPGDPAGVAIKIGRKRLQVLAKHWHFVMRSRQRWITDPELKRKVGDRAVRHLAVMGIGSAQLEKIGAAGTVQVSISTSESDSPSTGLEWGWEARLLPWEYVLAAATWKYRTQPLTVVRYLAGYSGHRNMGVPGTALFIQSAPGALRSEYQFDIEREVLARHLGQDVGWTPVTDPTEGLLRSATASTSPHLIHVSGLDNFQGARLLDPEQKTMPASSIRDGMYLRNEAWDETQVSAEAVANALTAGPQKPAMVTFNLYNSSARMAAFAVASGASAAIGFQDYVDDRLSEIFFANFYWYWRASG
jgi:hypothetical protein